MSSVMTMDECPMSVCTSFAEVLRPPRLTGLMHHDAKKCREGVQAVLAPDHRVAPLVELGLTFVVPDRLCNPRSGHYRARARSIARGGLFRPLGSGIPDPLCRAGRRASGFQGGQQDIRLMGTVRRPLSDLGAPISQ